MVLAHRLKKLFKIYDKRISFMLCYWSTGISCQQASLVNRHHFKYLHLCKKVYLFYGPGSYYATNVVFDLVKTRSVHQLQDTGWKACV